MLDGLKISFVLKRQMFEVFHAMNTRLSEEISVPGPIPVKPSYWIFKYTFIKVN